MGIFPLLGLCQLFFQLSQPLPSPFQYLGPGGGTSPSTSSLTLPTDAILGPQKSGLGKISLQLSEHSFEGFSVPLVPRPILTTSGLPGPQTSYEESSRSPIAQVTVGS